jgi:hypothetical protein
MSPPICICPVQFVGTHSPVRSFWANGIRLTVAWPGDRRILAHDRLALRVARASSISAQPPDARTSIISIGGEVVPR